MEFPTKSYILKYLICAFTFYYRGLDVQNCKKSLFSFFFFLCWSNNTAFTNWYGGGARMNPQLKELKPHAMKYKQVTPAEKDRTKSVDPYQTYPILHNC